VGFWLFLCLDVHCVRSLAKMEKAKNRYSSAGTLRARGIIEVPILALAEGRNHG
jgi:hypothetical protein